MFDRWMQILSLAPLGEGSQLSICLILTICWCCLTNRAKLFSGGGDKDGNWFNIRLCFMQHKNKPVGLWIFHSHTLLLLSTYLMPPLIPREEFSFSSWISQLSTVVTFIITTISCHCNLLLFFKLTTAAWARALDLIRKISPILWNIYQPHLMEITVVVQTRRHTGFEALKLWNSQSGRWRR